MYSVKPVYRFWKILLRKVNPEMQVEETVPEQIGTPLPALAIDGEIVVYGVEPSVHELEPVSYTHLRQSSVTSGITAGLPPFNWHRPASPEWRALNKSSIKSSRPVLAVRWPPISDNCIMPRAL